MNLSCDSSADQGSTFHHVYPHHYQKPEIVATSSGPATSSGLSDMENNHGTVQYYVYLYSLPVILQFFFQLQNATIK